MIVTVPCVLCVTWSWSHISLCQLQQFDSEWVLRWSPLALDSLVTLCHWTVISCVGLQWYFSRSDDVIVPRFLTMLEEEVYGANSPIWDVEFAHNAVHGSATNGAGTCHRFVFNSASMYHHCWTSPSSECHGSAGELLSRWMCLDDNSPYDLWHSKIRK